MRAPGPAQPLHTVAKRADKRDRSDRNPPPAPLSVARGIKRARGERGGEPDRQRVQNGDDLHSLPPARPDVAPQTRAALSAHVMQMRSDFSGQ